jgi:hypothetical protein
LLSISSEGGEHLHTPHKRYIKMSSFVVWACPRGVVEALTHIYAKHIYSNIHAT